MLTFTVDDIITGRVQELFIFRELLGVNTRGENDILVYFTRQQLQLISRRESSVEYHDTVLPDSIRDKWIIDNDDGYPIASIAAEMLRVSDEKTMIERLAWLRSQIEEIIPRIDKDQIDLINGFMERIGARLLVAINKGGTENHIMV